MRGALLAALVLVAACCVRQTPPTTPTPGPGPGPGPGPDPDTPPGPGMGGSDPNAACAKDRPCNPLPLDWCPADARPLPLKDLLASGQTHNGHVMAVTGPIRQGPTRCTKMACGPERPCCNKCSASLILSENADQSSPLGADDGVTLLGENLGCAGDDSGVCCTYAPDGRSVTAIGTLAVTGDAQSGFRYELQNADVCAYRVLK